MDIGLDQRRSGIVIPLLNINILLNTEDSSKCIIRNEIRGVK